MGNKIESTALIPALAVRTIRRTSSLEHQACDPPDSTTQLHNNFPKHLIPRSITVYRPLRMKRVLMIGKIICFNRFLGKIGDRQDKFIAVDMGEILWRWFSSDFPHYIPPPTEHKPGTLANNNIWVPRACVNISGSEEYL
jgi:hypothetical protein